VVETRVGVALDRVTLGGGTVGQRRGGTRRQLRRSGLVRSLSDNFGGLGRLGGLRRGGGIGCLDERRGLLRLGLGFSALSAFSALAGAAAATGADEDAVNVASAPAVKTTSSAHRTS
jgi:hypothetical protein